jgi:glycosyltransferase involved in cell wall biosynthesis
MKILLASGASYAPPKGGSTRSNLVWLWALVAKGHECRVVCTAAGEFGETVVDGIAIRRVSDLALHAERLTEEIRAYRPDWVLVSSEDVTQRLLRAAERGAPGRVVYLAHTPQFFPFGPESWNPDAEATRIVERAAGVVAIGQHMAAYIGKHSGAKAAVVHPPIYHQAIYGDAAVGAGGSLVLMINPCIVKGIEIFAEVAARLPELPFGALTGWGTTASDRALLARHKNIELIGSVRDIDEVLGRARMLLMPSIWYEGFGLIVMEAMLRGLPVVSSDSGGLMEAKAGTGYVIPVRPIERYEPVFDENHMPRPVRGAQDAEPWVAAVNRLASDDAAHHEEAERSRAAAQWFVGGLRVDALEEYLLSLKPRLTDAQRALLLKRLARQ